MIFLFGIFGLNGGETLVLAVLAGLVAWLLMKYTNVLKLSKGSFKTDEEETAGKARAYLVHSTPIGIFAHTLGDDTLLERLTAEKKKLTENNNPWDDDLPVVAYYPGAIIQTAFDLAGRQEVSVDLRGLGYKDYLYQATKSHLELCDKWEQAAIRSKKFSDEKILELVFRQKPTFETAHY